MSHHLDQLFREKLDHHTESPPPGAWAAIEAGMARRKRGAIAWRAAAVLVVAILSMAGWRSLPHTEADGPAAAARGQHGPDLRAADTLLPANPVQAMADKTKDIEKTPVASSPRARYARATPPTNEMAALPDAMEALPVVAVAAVVDPASGQTGKPLVVEFTLDPIEEPVVVTQTEKDDKTGVQRLLRKAREVKNGEHDFGIREAKNELMAWTFKREKEKSNQIIN